MTAIPATVPQWKDSSKREDVLTSAGAALDRSNVTLYLVGGTGLCLMYSSFHDIGLSTLLTLALLLQNLGLAMLVVAIITRKSVKGISLQSIGMQALSFMLRLCSTSWLKGYIPVDSTGDWLYQLADLSALLLCLQTCYFVQMKYRASYQEQYDTFPAKRVCAACVVLAMLIHPDLNNRPVFDTIWTAGLYVDVVSTLPQLWMIGKLEGKCDFLSAHYIALVAIARTVDLIFWSYGYEELAPMHGAFNIAGYTVLAAHAIHLLLMWDFIYCYCKAIYQGKFMNKQFDFGKDLPDV